MNGLARKLGRWCAGLITPHPSLFDVLACGVLATPYLPHGVRQETFFIFYILGLWCTCLMIKPKRQFKSLPLSLLCLWSLAGVFIHSFQISETSFVRQYLNMYLLSEGFIYILIGSVFISLCVMYSKNLKFAWLLTIPALFPFYTEYISGGRVTPIIALYISGIVYLLFHKRFLYAVLGIVLVTPILYMQLPWLKFKFACRPLVWQALSEKILQHPWIGMGFNKTLSHDNMQLLGLSNGITYGWVYNHNDFLALGMFLGIPAIVFIVWFATRLIYSVSKTILLIPALAIYLTCHFQMTMFDIGKASTGIVIIALIILYTIKQEESCVKRL